MNATPMFTAAEAAPGSIRMSDIIASASELKGLIAAETEMLNKMQMGSLGLLQDKKQALIDQLERKKKLIAFNRGVLAAYTQREREELQRLHYELDRVMAENAIQLIKAKEVNQMVVDAIAKALTRYFGKARGYNKNASDEQNFKRGEQAVPPVTVDKSI
ncbi:MAG: hypothetical protein EB060_08740 [Proteobacteria bacterium]|nr:hypothetical protein [Pseudomonadota bacterium]